MKVSASKKSLFAIEQARRDVAWRRKRWKSIQPHIDPNRLVFVDETWIKTNMTPLRGWGERGKRLRGFAPHGKWRTMTFLAALRCDGLTAPYVLDGPVNGIFFRAWVEQQLVPTLKPGDVVIMDNLGSHKAKAIRKAIRAAGATLLYLPPYSPDSEAEVLTLIETAKKGCFLEQTLGVTNIINHRIKTPEGWKII